MARHLCLVKTTNVGDQGVDGSWRRATSERSPLEYRCHASEKRLRSMRSKIRRRFIAMRLQFGHDACLVFSISWRHTPSR